MSSLLTMAINELEYEGKPIQSRYFNWCDKPYLSATAMAKAVGKRWNDYWSTQEAKDVCEEISLHTRISVCKLVVSHRARADRGGGTWIHPLVAVNFAQWCNAKFAVWVSQTILELPKPAVAREAFPILEQYAQLLIESNLQGREIIAQNRETLDVVRTNQRQMQDVLDHNNSVMRYLREFLDTIKKMSPQRLESKVQAELLTEEHGIAKVQCLAGIIDVVTDKWIIEIKEWNHYKHACGQVMLYHDNYLGNAGQAMRVHLFWRPGNTPPSRRRMEEIEEHCRRLGILCTWHKWGKSLLQQQQLMLGFTYDGREAG